MSLDIKQLELGEQQRPLFDDAEDIDTPLSLWHKDSFDENESDEDHPSPEFFDSLISLRWDIEILREFDRRTTIVDKPCLPPVSPVDPLSGSDLQQLKRLSRNGGPNLTHLRGLASLIDNVQRSSQESSTMKKINPYDAEFRLRLMKAGVYSDDPAPPEPHNLQQIRLRLAERRCSLSSPQFSDEDFQDFLKCNQTASNESTVIAEEFQFVTGSKKRSRPRPTWSIQFDDIKPFDKELTAPKPDAYDGMIPRSINNNVLEDLYQYVVPSKTTKYVAPNFFLEVKDPNGRPDVAQLQACYAGAVGARAMHALQNHGVSSPAYDRNAYTYSVTYQNGILRIFVMYPTSRHGQDPEYHMIQVCSFLMTQSRGIFREGATAYRNARDHAADYRRLFVDRANEVTDQHKSVKIFEGDPLSSPDILISSRVTPIKRLDGAAKRSQNPRTAKARRHQQRLHRTSTGRISKTKQGY